jgi:DNA-directed RNA polymerase specialized sigma subunit
LTNEYLNNKTFESVIRAFQQHKRQKSRYELIVSDLQQTHERRKKKYNDNQKKPNLEQIKQRHQEICDNFQTHQQQLAHAFYLLSENIAHWAKFNGIDMDDAIQEGVLICFEKIDRFDPRKGKAFNYLSTCVLNHLRQLYRGARNYNELKKRYHKFLQDKFENLVIRNGKERQNYDNEKTS